MNPIEKDRVLELEYKRLYEQYDEIDKLTTLPRINSEEMEIQMKVILNAEQQYNHQRKNMLTRHMSLKDECVAISIAKQYHGIYTCSCFGSMIRSPCHAKLMVTSSTEIKDMIVCEHGGDGGISIMKLLNLQGFSLVPNHNE
jgi:hypothetical protein